MENEDGVIFIPSNHDEIKQRILISIHAGWEEHPSFSSPSNEIRTFVGGKRLNKMYDHSAIHVYIA